MNAEEYDNVIDEVRGMFIKTEKIEDYTLSTSGYNNAISDVLMVLYKTLGKNKEKR